MATVHDVARRAGVSTSTVSHVVNNTRFVSDELRERVEAAMRELDYTPNAAARMLTLKRSHTIGLIVSDIRNPFFASVARGVEDVAQEQGYTLVLCNSDESAERETACLNALETRAVDGVLLASAGVADAHLARLVRAGYPLVLADRGERRAESGQTALGHLFGQQPDEYRGFAGDRKSRTGGAGRRCAGRLR